MNIIFSFDDGRSDAFEASKIMYRYNISGSFHVTTGFIDGTFQTNAFGKYRKSLQVHELIQMKKMGMEISSHGDTHIMKCDDFIISLKKLSVWGLITSGEKTGFSIPNSHYNADQLNEFIESCKNSLLYVRAGRSPKCYTFFSKVNYVLYKITKWQVFYNVFNRFNLIKNLGSMPIYSIVITKDIKAKNILRFINKYKHSDSNVVLMFHSIVENARDKWEYTIKNFELICREINSLQEQGFVKCTSFKEYFG